MQELLQQLQNPEMMAQITRATGVSEDEIQKVAALGVPTLIEAMNQNASNDEGAQSLAKALDDHADDNPYDTVGFLDRFLGGEGGRMVDHIFTGNKGQVEDTIAARTGVQASAIKKILSFLAPLILANMASKWSKGQRERQQQQQQPQKRQQPQQNSPFDSPFGGSPAPEIDLPGNRKITMPGANREQDVRDFTRQTQRDVQEQAGGSIFDMAKDILGGGSGQGGLLEDLLGGLFGKK